MHLLRQRLHPREWQREELPTLAWSSLDSDEQKWLTNIGFDPLMWDKRELPQACKELFYVQDANVHVAAAQLPIPNTDPYWKTYWAAFAKQRATPVEKDLERLSLPSNAAPSQLATPDRTYPIHPNRLF